MISDKTLDYSKRITTALLGVDILYRSESEDEDGLVVVNLDTRKEYSPEKFDSYDTARKWFEQFKKEAAGLPERDRQRYYDQLCHSTLSFITWRTSDYPFISQLKDFLHVPVQPASESELKNYY